MSYVAKKVRTRYVLAEGKKNRYVPKGTAGARQVKERSDDYYGFWINTDGRKESVRFKNCREKQAAQVELNEHLKKVSLHKAGLGPDPKEALAWEETPVEGHFQAYLAHLRGEGRSAQYVREVERQARAVFAGVGARVMKDLKPEKVHDFLASLPGRGDPPRPPSARTRETYRQAVCYFTAWLVRPSVKRLPLDLLASLGKIEGVAVRSRRSLDDADLQKLLDAARARPLANFRLVTKGRKKSGAAAQVGERQRERLALCGLQRTLVYKTAVLTLARFGAIRKLTVDALHLDAATPYAVFPATTVKRRKEINKPLPPELAEDLRRWLERTGKKAGDRVFDLNTQITRELRKDLEFAGIPYKDGLGRTFDFHAFKKCGVTALARANVNLTSAKDYAEHSDVRLTVGAYRDAAAQPMGELFDALPRIH